MTNKHIPRKRFGQNFLNDRHIIAAILAAINPLPKQHIIEIGPGQGALTNELINSGAIIDAIEIDRDLAAYLQENYSQAKNFNLHCSDVLKFHFPDLITKQHPDKLRLVGNLPYNISTPLLFKLFASIDIIHDMFFMLQREVALRLIAQTDTKEYGRMSVMAQYYCNMQIVLDIPASAFTPAPKVESCIVQFIPHIQPTVTITQPNLLQQIVTHAFSQRRKTIANSLKEFITATELHTLDIDPQLRAENLNLTNYATITNYIALKQG